MAEAEAAAANAAPASISLPVPANNNVSGPLAVTKPSMDSFIESGGMDVDEFLKINEEGFRIGDKMQGLLDEAVVTIDLTEVTPIIQSRHEAGGKTTFLKSYDGATTVDGKSFQGEFERLSRLNVKNDGPFQTCEIPMTLVDDVEDPKKGSSIRFDAGTRVGVTPSKTGARDFQKFLKSIRNQNPALLQGEVTVKITHARRENSNGNKWGVLNYELVQS